MTTFYDCSCESCRIGKVNRIAMEGAQRWFPESNYRYICPACDDLIATPLMIMIAHINDVHKWSFVEIANWLEKENADVLITNI